MRKEVTPETLAAFWMSSPFTKARQMGLKQGFRTMRHSFIASEGLQLAANSLRLEKPHILALANNLVERRILKSAQEQKQPFVDDGSVFYFRKVRLSLFVAAIHRHYLRRAFPAFPTF
jgi:hypothetical protein